MSALVSYESSDEAEEVDNNATATLKVCINNNCLHQGIQAAMGGIIAFLF